MPDWRNATLGGAAGLTTRPPRPFHGSRPYLATADVQDGIASPAEEVTFARLPARAGLQVAEGDLLQAKMVGTDKAFRVTRSEDGWLASTGFAQFAPGDAGASVAFFYHWLRSREFHRAKDRLCVGSTQQAISQPDLGSIPIALPSFQEQEAVGRVLDSADRCLRSTEATIVKLRRIRDGLLQDLLTRGIDQDGRVRDPHRDPGAFVQTDGGLMPRTWKVRTLERLADPQAPIGYGIVQVFEHVPNGVPVLAIRDLLGDYVTGVHITAPAIDAQYARSRVRPGDVLISIKGTIGRIGIVPEHYRGNISRDLARVRPAAGVVPEFLMHLLRSPRGQKTLEMAQVGTTRAELSIAPLRKLTFAIPEEDEQRQIARILNEQDETIVRYEGETQKLRCLIEGLMFDLFTGSVRIPARMVEGWL